MKHIGFIFIFLSFFLAGGARVFAHGGEDHGDQKPKATTGEKGTITRSARLGEYELTFKHPPLEPDTQTAAHLFVTKFQTNEAVGQANPAVEIESANGAVTQAEIEKTETDGIYNVKIPALPEGVYTIRAKFTHSGAIDAATFSDVEVNPQAAASADGGAMSWARTALIGFVFALVLAMFGGLIYFVWRYAGNETPREEVVSV